jgi:hypothetical protein
MCSWHSKGSCMLRRWIDSNLIVSTKTLPPNKMMRRENLLNLWNEIHYCWFKPGSVGRGLTTFITPFAVDCKGTKEQTVRHKDGSQVNCKTDNMSDCFTSKKEFRFNRKRKRLKNGVRWLPASRLLRRIVYKEFDFLLNSY